MTVLAAVILLAPLAAQAGDFSFMPLDIYIDSGDEPLAAYQFELRYDSWAYSIAGIEGGEGALSEAPYYDPRGMDAGRIVIASFTTERTPPAGRVRVATVHIAVDEDVTADEDFAVILVVAAGPEEQPVRAEIEIVRRHGEDGGEHK
jgi:hypothetical protein